MPWIYGAAVGSYGLTMPVIPGRTACLRCVYPDPPAGVQPTCETAGVLNAIVAAVASLQVADALKILCGRADLVRRAHHHDGRVGGRHPADRRPAAGPGMPRAAAVASSPIWRNRRARRCSLCGRNAVQIHERERPIDLAELKARLEPLGEVRANEFALRFIIAPYEMTVFPDGRAIVKGTSDTGVARSLYARYVG